MIRIGDAFLLARTKLRLRIVRLSVTIFISSLLFAVLIFVATVFTGAIQSFSSFQQEGYGGRYIVKATPLGYNAFGSPDDKTLLTHFAPIQAELIAQKKAAAKKLNITYDPLTDQTLPFNEIKQPNGSTDRFINTGAPFVSAYVEEMNKQKNELSFENFMVLAKKYQATAFYQSTVASFYSFNASPPLLVLKDGKEDFSGNSSNNQYTNGPPTGLATLTSLGWFQYDEPLLEPFVLPGQSLVVGKDGSIPVIAPFSAAEEITGLKALSQTASSAQRLERLQQVRKQVAGKTAVVCYRNPVSSTLLQEAISQRQQIEQNKGKADYQPPALQYQLPGSPCGAVTVKKDTRSAEEKTAAKNEEAFKRQFGVPVDAEQGIITVRVVGITSEPSYSPALNATSIASGILQSSLGSGWFSPAKAMSQNQYLRQAGYAGEYASIPMASRAYFAEFESLENERAFIKSLECQTQMQTGPPAVGFDPCVDKGKPFTVVAYGNNAGAIEEFRKGFWKVAQFFILGAVILASLILMGNVGKIIADSRRETAVFRALGAKRLDIGQIYITYSLLIAVIVFACALLIGLAAALYLNAKLSPAMSIAAVLAYNAADTTKQFIFYGVDLRLLTGVFGLVVAAALISTLLPLFGNLRRNPIRDMRDEG